MAARISAEYSSLLGIIRGRTGQLIRQFGDYSPAHSALQDVRDAVSAAEQLTEKLAALGERRVVRSEVISMNTILRRLSKSIEMAAGTRVVTVIQPDPSAGRIKADFSQIEQILMSLVLHACALVPSGGRLLIQTTRVEAPQDGALASFAACSLSYSAIEANPDRLFDPGGNGLDSLALSVAHSIAAEHGGYLTAHSASDGTRMELLLPRLHEEAAISEPQTAAGDSRTILLVDPRDRVRAQLHKFFESAGYNLLETADPEEALALAQVHEGALHLLVAEASEAAAILPELAEKHPEIDHLKIVDGTETSEHEIRRPFTQQALLERCTTLLERRQAPRHKLDSALPAG